MTKKCKKEHFRELEDQIAEFRARHEKLLERTAELDAETHQAYCEKAAFHESDEAIMTDLETILALTGAFEHGVKKGGGGEATS